MNPTDLGWYCPLELIKRAGHLTELVVAAQYLREAAIWHASEEILPIHFAWLSYYDDDNVEEFINDIVFW